MGVAWNGVLQALLISLAIQMIISVLCVLCACLWKSIKERMSRPPGGEVNAEPDVEMGTMNGGEEIDHPGVADHDHAHHELGNDLEVNEKDIPVHGDEPNPQRAHVPANKGSRVHVETMAHVIKDETQRASLVPVELDATHTQQVEVLIQKMIKKEAVMVEGVEVGRE